jgi:hypothetical protein
MGRRRKDGLTAQIEQRRKARTTQEHADYQASIWVALHGTVKAEIVALLTLEKIRAQIK